MSFVTRQKSDMADVTDKVLCYYVNSSSELQILRIQGPADFYFEKVAFSQERLLFDAPHGAVLQVFTQSSADLTQQRIPCEQLQVRESSVSG